MEKVTDRIILYIFCTAFMLVSDVGMVSIIAMLSSIVFTGLETFFENKNVSVFFSVLYIILCLIYPDFVIYMPIMLYNVFLRKYYYIALLYIVPFVKYGIGMPVTVIIMILGIYLAFKTDYSQSVKNRFMKIQERSMEIQILLKRKQAEMSEHQGDEIRLATMTERNRIAREIHDNVGHMLSRSILQAGAIQTINKDETLKEPLEQLQNTLNTAMSSIRESVHDLKDDSVDLNLMVKGIIHEYEDISISFDYDEDGEFPKNIKYCFIAIIKEALTNVVKHSNATTVNITIVEHPAFYQLIIYDNGSIEPDMDSDGIGLENMRERVAALNGSIRFAYNNGFKIFVSVKKI